jgi:uncharacterized integral membrane protein (TIGR00697 family)
MNIMEYENKNSNINSRGLGVLLIISMFYVSSVTFSTTFTHRYMEIGTIFILGGTFNSPPYFILADIVAEIYGPKIAKIMVIFAFIFQIIFAIFAQFIIRANSPTNALHNDSYYFVFNPLFKLSLESFIAYYVSGIINIKIISKLKVKLQGEKYWLRSLFSSTVSEALYSGIAILSMEIFSLSSSYILKAIIASYIVKLIFSLVTMIPCQKLVSFLKKYTGIDVFDTETFTAKNNLTSFNI